MPAAARASTGIVRITTASPSPLPLTAIVQVKGSCSEGAYPLLPTRIILMECAALAKGDHKASFLLPRLKRLKQPGYQKMRLGPQSAARHAGGRFILPDGETTGSPGLGKGSHYRERQCMAGRGTHGVRALVKEVKNTAVYEKAGFGAAKRGTSGLRFSTARGAECR